MREARVRIPLARVIGSIGRCGDVARKARIEDRRTEVTKPAGQLSIETVETGRMKNVSEAGGQARVTPRSTGPDEITE
jgi:hypothetical protein